MSPFRNWTLGTALIVPLLGGAVAADHGGATPFAEVPPAVRIAHDPADTLYQEARAALARGDNRNAARLFRRIVDEEPGSQYAPDALYWQLTRLGIHCDVIAPSLIPTKAGERIKTDRRDAEKLARSYRSGDLTSVWVPDARHEALRDLVRAREAAKEDQLRAKHRLGKYLLRNGQRPEDGCRAWTAAWWQWRW